MEFMKFYLEDKKEDLAKKWKLLEFLEEEEEEKEKKKINLKPVSEKKSDSVYKISRLKELLK
jgi:hypothetical protein